MNKSLIAGAAMFAGIALAMPMLAHSADNPPTADQTTPIIPPAGPATPAGGMPGHPGMGMGTGMMGPGGPLRAMMMHRMMMHLSPAQRCEERLARHAGRIAYVVTKLNLTAEQRPLWDKLNAIAETGTAKQQQLCAALKSGPPPAQRTILDRVDWLEQSLAARVQALHEARPALEQLYKALTPEQQAIINHPFAHR